MNSNREEAGPSLVEYDNGVTELYFSSNRAGGFSNDLPDTDTDLYVSVLQANGSWGLPLLVAGVNTASDDSRPNLRRDGLEMFFDSTRDGAAMPDIWTSTRTSPGGAWSIPVPVPNVNSGAAEARPFPSWDGTQLFLGTTREGSFDLYVATRIRNP